MVTEQILKAALAQPEDEDLAVMRLSLIDWMACGLAGRNEPVSKITRALVMGDGFEDVDGLEEVSRRARALHEAIENRLALARRG